MVHCIPAESTNENGEKIISVCTTHNLTLVNTWKASAADQAEWNGETHVGPQGTKQRVDYFAVSDHAFEEVEQVKAQIKAAMRLRPGGVKPGREIFDHIPLTMVHRYKLAVKKTRKGETTRWHFARLKHAMDDPEAEHQFRADLQQWIETEGQNIRLRMTEQDVEQAWLPIARGVHELAKKHFATRKGPREQWLSERTWEMMRKRTWLVDSLWKEADIAEVSEEVVRLTKEIRKSCRQDKRDRIDRLGEEMDEASRNRDGKKVWECARADAGTGLGLKRRVFQPPDEVPITGKEWDEYMKDTFRAQLASPLGPQPSKGCVLGQLPPKHEFLSTIEHSKNNKSVAEGDVPNEVWKLIIRDERAAQIVYELFQQSLREGVNPAAFCTSPLAPIDKGNNKKGCKSKRPVSICNSLGKQFHKTLYRHHVKEHTPPWSFGNVKGRRREEACLIVRLCMARCRRAKRSCAYNFRDAKSAFPSLEHHAIVQAFRRRVPMVVSRLFEDLYNRATMVLRLHSGDWRVWKAGRGTRQGDSTGSDIFCATYNEAVIAAKAARPARPHQTLQYNGRTVDPSLLTFVDDIAELTIDEKTKHGALHSIEQQIKKTLRPLFLRWRRLDASSSSQKRWLFRRGWALAHSALQGWQETREGSQVVPKPLQRDIWEISSTSTAPTAQSFGNASQRLTLDSMAYAGVWRSRNISFKSKSLFFKNMVLNALLSGLEICVFNQGEINKLQVHADKLARRALGRKGWGAVKNDPNKTSVPSRWVRAQLGIWTIESTLRYRRLRWFHSMSKQAFHHDLVWAALFGRFCWENDELDENMHPIETSLPFVKQLAADLQAVGCYGGFRTGWQLEFARVDGEQFEKVLKRDRDKITRRFVAPKSNPVPESQSFVEDIEGGWHRCECGKGFMSKQALRLHQFRKHRRIDTRTAHIIANQCPRCTLPLSSIPHTERHWLADMCGHPSTQKGPSTAHTAEIKVVHARLKRARELGIQAAPVVPVNYDVPRQLHEQRKRIDRRAGQQEEQEPGRVEADRQPGLQAPPARGGQVTFFLSQQKGVRE